MTTSFTRAMHLISSFMATVATTSFNFAFTAILSMLVFGETLRPLWCPSYHTHACTHASVEASCL